jgi:hypothetical protein
MSNGFIATLLKDIPLYVEEIDKDHHKTQLYLFCNMSLPLR